MTIHSHKIVREAEACAEVLSVLAVRALVEEVELTPKPGLVDQNGPGAHTDLTIEKMLLSAKSLKEGFFEMAISAYGQQPGAPLRERLGEIGRRAEASMMVVTGGVNTHRGAIWSLGLLTAGVVIAGMDASPVLIAAAAAEIAKCKDRFVQASASNGSRAKERFGASGARGEAERGFPHVVHVALPVLHGALAKGISETQARIDALLSIMAQLDDTCLLQRGGLSALEQAKQGARSILDLGGASTPAGWDQLLKLGELLVRSNASPGGSADLLAAALFLDSIGTSKKAR